VDERETSRINTEGHITKVINPVDTLNQSRQRVAIRRRFEGFFRDAGILVGGGGLISYFILDKAKPAIDQSLYSVLDKGALVAATLGAMSLVISFKFNVQNETETVLSETDAVLQTIAQLTDNNVIDGTATPVETDSKKLIV
jgi:hypothetical protein